MLSTQELDKLREENPAGIVHLIGTGNKWECVFRAPRRAEYKMFRANCHNDARKADANEVLAKQCCVYPPSRDAFDALLDVFPAIPEALATDDDFKAMTGVTVEEGSKQ
jgi:hypothetical protein